MIRKKIFTTIFFVLSTIVVVAQELKMCGYQGYQTVEEVNDACELQGAVLAASVSQEAEEVVDDILAKVGLFRNFLIQECEDINNALAVTMPLEGGDLERYILYDQLFFNNVSASTGTDWGNTSILAHEVGHHLNGHTLKAGGSNHKTELQADEFSGFVLARMGCSLEDAQSAVNELLPDEASATHPGKQDRLNAIAKGWSRGSGKEIVIQENQEEEDENEITVEKVLADYIEAIGGEEKVTGMKTFSINVLREQEANGMNSSMRTFSRFLTPSVFITDVSFENPEMAAIVPDTQILTYHGKQYKKVNEKWSRQENTDNFSKTQTSYIPEYTQLVNNNPARYLGVEMIDGEECYVVEFEAADLTLNSTYQTTKYYSVHSGLLYFEKYQVSYQTETEQSGMSFEKKYQDYQEFEGVLFSTKQEEVMTMVSDLLPGKRVSKTTIYVEDIELNPPLEEKEFSLKASR